jgi:hypothetical protein
VDGQLAAAQGVVDPEPGSPEQVERNPVATRALRDADEATESLHAAWEREAAQELDAAVDGVIACYDATEDPQALAEWLLADYGPEAASVLLHHWDVEETEPPDPPTPAEWAQNLAARARLTQQAPAQPPARAL